MTTEVSPWNNVMSMALKVPGIKVNRDEFLTNELRQRGCPDTIIEQAISINPVKVIDSQMIESIANSCISSHTIKVTSISAVAGIPGGFGMLGTIPADVVNYYYHVFVLSQKLAYIYGFPDLCNEKGEMTDTSIALLTLFVGVMMGAAEANKVISNLAKKFAEQVVKRLPQQALTKTMFYPLIKQIAKWLGVQVTKSSFSKVVGKLIPVVGGVISGGITLATFRPQAKRLQKKLREQSIYFTQETTKTL